MRRLRILRNALSGATLLLVLATSLSFVREALLVASDGAWCLSLSNGCLVYGSYHRRDNRFYEVNWERTRADSYRDAVSRGQAIPPGFTVRQVRSRFWSDVLLPKYSQGQPTVLRTPLWIPLTIVLVPGAILWRLELRRVPPGHCSKCRFDLTGNVSGICPECGTRARSEAKAVLHG